MTQEEVQDLEIRLLLQAVRDRFGYDFHDYSPAMLKRRILSCLSRCGFRRISQVITRLLDDESFLNTFICALTVSVSDFFRDPLVMLRLRQNVIPMLATYSHINIWHAGCATGEEIYSLAILLKEAGIYERTRIYATDINDESLQAAREGIYAADSLEKWSENYRISGGTRAFSDYVHLNYGQLMIDPALRERMVFARHNLAGDSVFAEMHLVACRNVMIYFNRDLRDRTLTLFADSLVRGGFLCLGNSESLRFTSVENLFSPLSEKERIYVRRSDREALP